MPTVVERVTDLAVRIGQDIKALRTGKADDTAVVHRTGNETINGTKTFGSAPLVPLGSNAANPVRRDDGRLTDSRPPTAHATTHGTAGSDPITPSSIGASATGHAHAPLNIAQAAAPSSPTAGMLWLDTDDDAAGVAPPAFGSMVGSPATTAPDVIIASGASQPGVLTTVDHTITIPTAGRLTARAYGQFAAVTGEGYAGRCQTSPVLAGASIVSGDGATVLATEDGWNEACVLDNGFGLYGQCSIACEVVDLDVLAAGTYRVRLSCWSFRGDANTPRARLLRVKTRWILVP